MGGAQEAANFDLTFWTGLWVISYTHHPITRELSPSDIRSSWQTSETYAAGIGGNTSWVWAGEGTYICWWRRGKSFKGSCLGRPVGEEKVRAQGRGIVCAVPMVPLCPAQGQAPRSCLLNN